MKPVKLLDCTLRDGGYVNNWTFGYNSIINIYKKLDASGLDIIELGYIRSCDLFSYNRTSSPDVEALNKVFGGSIAGKKTMLVAMIDLGSIEAKDICTSDLSILDGLRVTFKKNKIAEALEFSREVIQKGYKLFLQPVSITDYSEQEYLKLIQRVNTLNPFAFSIVDTYGLLQKKDLLRYFDLLEANLKLNICIGYHPHNNFQLAFSNAVELINRDNREHELIIDSTVGGIGKDSGNASTELLIHYLNRYNEANYKISYIFEIIHHELAEMNRVSSFGTIGLISAISGCRPEYTTYLFEKKIPIESILNLLSRIDKDKKTTFYNLHHIEQLYRKYEIEKI